MTTKKMPESYTIENDDNFVRVNGTLQDDGCVEVTVNGDTYVYHSGNGNLTLNTVSASLVAKDGARIEEGATSQEITLPDKTFIRRGAASKTAKFPDGTEISSSNSGSGVSIQITSNKTKITTSGGTSMSAADISVNTNKSVSNTDEQRKTYPKQEFIDDIIPGFWTTVVLTFGLFNQSPSTLAFATVMYATYALPAVIRYTGYQWADNTDTEREENNEQHEEPSTEEQIDALKKKFVDGEINEEEFDRQLENLIEEDVNETQTEYVTN